ncbi:MAG: hypothetical protein IKW97_07910 [Muribaculaceae bacterium]|nr:hypothetical protein [Muribaculaceae bacterium]
MSNKEKDILEALKNKLIETAGISEDDFLSENDECKTQNCIYYLRDLKDNLQKDQKNYSMHLENYSKKDTGRNRYNVIPMAALRSSAALIYNILGDDDECELNFEALSDSSIELNLISGKYQLQYEWKYKTISRSRANIDAHLSNEENNCHLFIEMKMLEPLTKTHPFDSYSSYKNSSDCPDVFKDAFDYFVGKKLEYFDACQMIKHLLAIYNYFKDNPPKETQNVVLLNCHWEPLNHCVNGISLKDTYTAFDNFAKEFESMRDCFQEKLFAKLNVNLVLAHCTHSDLKKMVGKENDEYLKRYEI